MHRIFLAAQLCIVLHLPGVIRAAEPAESLPPGHSWHGETFNEGPRQQAYLMKGMPEVSFSITTKSREAQRFFDQGIGQLHGFWYFEAERSFRQAHVLDTNAPMPFWGMAMSNAGNATRARGFLTNAVALKMKASVREQMFIDALAAFHTETRDGKPVDSKTRRRELIRAYEAIVEAHPGDIEAKAFLLHQIWDNSGFGNSGDLAISSHLPLDMLARQILSQAPLHPVHHYRIHLWDPENPSNALNSAALCGSGSPGIAHMWHMPGHTYAKLSRHDDAAWQQEASARVDHAYMIRDRVLPDQIHNYTHNNDWLVESYAFSGRVREALALARNMVELPRLMKTNSALATQPKAHAYDYSRSSWSKGRGRLLTLLPKFELWDELLRLAAGPHLGFTTVPDEDAQLAHATGVALFAVGKPAEGFDRINQIEAAMEKVREERQAAVDAAEARTRKERKKGDEVQKAMSEALQSFHGRIEKMEGWIAELKVWSALENGETNEFQRLMETARDLPRDRKVLIHLKAGEIDKAEKLAREGATSATNQVFETAQLAEVLMRAGKRSEAEAAFERLRTMRATIDLDLPILARLKPLTEPLGADWRIKHGPRPDFGTRPELDTLGPLHWTPPLAPSWALEDVRGRKRGSSDYRGKPVVMLFFLGHGCVHCMEQLNAFAELAPRFEKAGLNVIAVSTDSIEGLKKTSTRSAEKFPFPLLADPSLQTFKAFKAYDGFERIPLHGTFLVDGQGALRWQDISFEPFLQPEFLLMESQRLLGFGSEQGKNPVVSGKSRGSQKQKTAPRVRG